MRAVMEKARPESSLMPSTNVLVQKGSDRVSAHAESQESARSYLGKVCAEQAVKRRSLNTDGLWEIVDVQVDLVK